MSDSQASMAPLKVIYCLGFVAPLGMYYSVLCNFGFFSESESTAYLIKILEYQKIAILDYSTAPLLFFVCFVLVVVSLVTFILKHLSYIDYYYLFLVFLVKITIFSYLCIDSPDVSPSLYSFLPPAFFCLCFSLTFPLLLFSLLFVGAKITRHINRNYLFSCSGVITFFQRYHPFKSSPGITMFGLLSVAVVAFLTIGYNDIAQPRRILFPGVLLLILLVLSTYLCRSVANALDNAEFKLLANLTHSLRNPTCIISNRLRDLKCLIGKHEDSFDSDENKKVLKYTAVLERQSNLLTMLLEKTIDATRSNTGDVLIEMGGVDLCKKLEEVKETYSDELMKLELCVDWTLPETAQVRADGTLLASALDELFCNIIKYAKPKTKITAEATTLNKDIRLLLRNSLKNPINLSGQELTRRFIQGENTQGLGLGLSIIKRDIERMGGVFVVDVNEVSFQAVVVLNRHLPKK